jgi:hypothetical protein
MGDSYGGISRGNINVARASRLDLSAGKNGFFDFYKLFYLWLN